jgi:hypothetical protein
MDHLVCFVSGLFALGVHRGAVAGAEAAQHLGTAGRRDEAIITIASLYHPSFFRHHCVSTKRTVYQRYFPLHLQVIWV